MERVRPTEMAESEHPRAGRISRRFLLQSGVLTAVATALGGGGYFLGKRDGHKEATETLDIEAVSQRVLATIKENLELPQGDKDISDIFESARAESVVLMDKKYLDDLKALENEHLDIEIHMAFEILNRALPLLTKLQKERSAAQMRRDTLIKGLKRKDNPSRSGAAERATEVRPRTKTFEGVADLETVRGKTEKELTDMRVAILQHVLSIEIQKQVQADDSFDTEEKKRDEVARVEGVVFEYFKNSLDQKNYKEVDEILKGFEGKVIGANKDVPAFLNEIKDPKTKKSEDAVVSPITPQKSETPALKAPVIEELITVLPAIPKQEEVPLPPRDDANIMRNFTAPQTINEASSVTQPSNCECVQPVYTCPPVYYYPGTYCQPSKSRSRR